MKTITAALIVGMVTQLAHADVCDYRPSNVIGKGSTALIAGGSGAAAATGAGMKVAGIYAITNATTGAAMLGSTAVGASAAGTTGIIAGSAGALGAIGTALMSPIVIIPAAAVAVGAAAYEGGCHIAGKK